MNKQARWFDCYQHDGSREFRIELRGYFDASSVADVKGTWLTAQSIMKGKDFVVDIRALHDADGPARQLLADMREAGARWIVHSPFSRQFASGGADGLVTSEEDQPCRRVLLRAWASAATVWPLRRTGRLTRS